MILIDSIYIHSYGGLSILKAFIKGLNNYSIPESDFHFLIDDRIDLASIKELKIYKIIKVKSGHFNRKKVYKSIIKQYDKILCLSNIPPPIKIDKKVYIYFHNLLLINSVFHLTSLNEFLLNFLKAQYIKFFNRKSYSWITQTNYTKNLISKKFNITLDSINVIPFFDISDIPTIKRNFKSNTINYLCVTSNAKHKNIQKLINAFIKANFSSEKKITLSLTLEGENKLIDNKKIKFIGNLNRAELIKKYSESHYLIFPSMIESFGLPMIEGVKSGANILCSNIKSISEILKPSINFNPLKESEIKIAIEKSATLSYNSNSELTIKNEINNFIKLIYNNV